MDIEAVGAALRAPMVSRNAYGRAVAPRGPTTRPARSRITVLLARARGPLFEEPPAAMAAAYGVRLVEDHVPEPRLLLPSLQRHRPDVLLLDEAILAELDARSLAQVQACCAKVRVLLVGQEVHPRLAEELLRHRFHGFLSGACSAEACLEAARAVSRGELWLPRALLGRAVSHLMQSCMFDTAPLTAEPHLRREAGGALTGRETQIVEFVRQGLTNKEIERRLGIMEDTVKKHLQGVFGKLGVRRRTLVALNHLARQ